MDHTTTAPASKSALPKASNISAKEPEGTRTADYRLKRDDDLPLLFTGAIIGHATEETRTNDCRQEVILYRSTGGKLIGSTFFDANFMKQPTCKAEVFDSANALIAWLRDEESNKLSPLAMEALRDAAAQDEEIAATFGETIP